MAQSNIRSRLENILSSGQYQPSGRRPSQFKPAEPIAQPEPVQPIQPQPVQPAQPAQPQPVPGQIQPAQPISQLVPTSTRSSFIWQMLESAQPAQVASQISEIILEFELPIKTGTNYSELPEDKYLYPSALENPGDYTIAQIPGDSDYKLDKSDNPFIWQIPQELPGINNILLYNKQTNPQNLIIPITSQNKIKGILYSQEPKLNPNPQAPYGQINTADLNKMKLIYQNSIRDIINHNNIPNNIKFTCFRLFLLCAANSCPINPIINLNNKQIRNPLHVIYCKDIAIATLMAIFQQIPNQNNYLNKIKIPGFYCREFMRALEELCIPFIPFKSPDKTIIIKLDQLNNSQINSDYNLFSKYYYPTCNLLAFNIDGHILINTQTNNYPTSNPTAGDSNIIQQNLYKIYQQLEYPFEIIRIYNQYNYQPIIYQTKAYYIFILPNILYNNKPIKLKPNYKFEQFGEEELKILSQIPEYDTIMTQNGENPFPANPITCKPGFKLTKIFINPPELVSEINIEFINNTGYISESSDCATIYQYEGDPDYKLDPDFIAKIPPSQLTNLEIKLSESKPNNPKNILINFPPNFGEISAILYTNSGLPKPIQKLEYGQLKNSDLENISSIYGDAITQIQNFNKGPEKLTCFRINLLSTDKNPIIQPITEKSEPNILFDIYCKDICLATIIGLFKNIFQPDNYIKKIQIDSKYQNKIKLALYELCIPPGDQTNIKINMQDIANSKINFKYNLFTKYYYPDCFILSYNQKSEILTNKNTNNIPKSIINPGDLNILTNIITNQIYERVPSSYLDLNLIYSQFNFTPVIKGKYILFSIPSPPIIYFNKQQIKFNKKILFINPGDLKSKILLDYFKPNSNKYLNTNIQKQNNALANLITCYPDIQVINYAKPISQPSAGDIILEFEGPENILVEIPGCSTITQDPGNTNYTLGGPGSKINQIIYNILNPDLSAKYQREYLQIKTGKNIIIPLNNPKFVNSILYTINPNFNKNRKSYGYLKGDNLFEIREIYEDAITKIIQYNNTNPKKITCFRLALLAADENSLLEPLINQEPNPLYKTYTKDIAMASLAGIFSTISGNINKILIPKIFRKQFLSALFQLCIDYKQLGSNKFTINKSHINLKSDLNQNRVFNNKYYYSKIAIISKNNQGEYLFNSELNKIYQFPYANIITPVLGILDPILQNKIFISQNQADYFILSKIYSELNFIPMAHGDFILYLIPSPPEIKINNNIINMRESCTWKKISNIPETAQNKNILSQISQIKQINKAKYKYIRESNISKQKNLISQKKLNICGYNIEISENNI